MTRAEAKRLLEDAWLDVQATTDCDDLTEAEADSVNQALHALGVALGSLL